MDFIKQITNLNIVTVTKPRVFIQWQNTEKGRDKYNCYERIADFCLIRYVNTHNPSSTIIEGDDFFKTLEEMYKSKVNNS